MIKLSNVKRFQRTVSRYESGNQKQYIEGQKIQLLNGTKGQTMIKKKPHCIVNYRMNNVNPTKTRGDLWCSGRVELFCSTS
jgi:hypothetical protein